MLEKRPRPYLLPIIVPRGARIEPSDMPGYVVEMEWKWIVLLVLAGFGLYALAEEKGPSTAKGRGLGDLPKKAKTKRLYYMIEKPLPGKRYRGSTFVSIPHSEAREQFREARKTGRLPLRNIYPLYAKSAAEARGLLDAAQKEGKYLVKPWTPEQEKQMELFGGVSANCMAWERFYSPHLDHDVWRCGLFEAACKPPLCDEKPKGGTGRLRVCSDWQKIFSFHLRKDVRRCKKYSPICGTRGCITSPAPKPDEDVLIEADVKALAKEMARREKEAQTEFGPELAREIKTRGGIAPYKGGFLKEEYANIPLHLKNRKGLGLDEMASEMGLTERELVVQIENAYGTKLTPKSWLWTDYEQAAYEELKRQGLAAAQYKQQDLFPGLRREMVLEIEDVAKSDDPVTMCLERKGWTLSRIPELRNSIIRKRQPDVMTGKVGKLTRSEKELEAHTDECFRQAVAGPTKGPPVQQTLLGGFSWFR